MDKEKKRKASRDAYAANKEKINKRRRELYAVNKDEINKRRRQRYAEKKNIRECTKIIVEKGSCSSSGYLDNQVSTAANIVVRFMSPLRFENVNEKGSSSSSLHSEKQKSLTSTDGIVGDQSACPLLHELSTKNIDQFPSEAAPYGALISATVRSNGGSNTRNNLLNGNGPEQDSRTLVLPNVPNCKHCGAYKFYRETDTFCCSGGEVRLAESILPDYIVDLLTSTDAKAKDFRNMIRTYNNHFAFTSIGMSCDEKYERRDRGVYTVRVQGQVHHYLDDLIPNDTSKKLMGIQFYFFDPDHQVSNRLSTLPRLDPAIVEELVKLLAQNPYAQFLRRASELNNIDDYSIVIRSEPDLDQRVYNKPTSAEVAGIWIEDESGENDGSSLYDIRVYTKSGQSHRVQCFYGCYDPLQYVLMFPAGEPGWHNNIKKIKTASNNKKLKPHSIPAEYHSFEDMLVAEQSGAAFPPGEDLQLKDRTPVAAPSRDNNTSATVACRKRKNISCREYYAYKLQIRENDRSFILQFGRLLQQYVIDAYIKIESMRLSFHRNNQRQKMLRREHYQGIVDSVIAGVQSGAKIGKRIYLPPTFIGGPRDMRQRYLDSMALVQEFGRPDLFLTMTCNPNWTEIKQLLAPGEEAHNRPDLLARVFKAKLSIMNDQIMSGEIFGKIASVVHVIEFQKRGLPHAHFLIILKPAFKYLTPEAYDRVVCAELPSKSEDPYLYSLVVKHMMHGPCGSMNPHNVCMKDGKCKNHYAKNYSDYTTHGKGSYPIYRRRNDGNTAKVRGHTLDNRWVIPYNPRLLLLFNCHINVEICCDIRAVKYLYKYVYKGHDKVMFRIAADNPTLDIDEISNFQNARWVSPVEACWRIFSFPLHGMYPSVLQMQVHLPNYQTIQFEDDSDLLEVLHDERQQRSMLTEFFALNSTSVKAMQLNLIYKKFPEHFVWDPQARTWTARKRGHTIGRICVVNPLESERYYLRVLLNHVECPTSFEDLLTVNGYICKTFQESAFKRGLLHDDDDIEKSLEEASVYHMPSELRRLFATILFYCKPSNPKKLFEAFFDHMAEDFTRMQEKLFLSKWDIQHKVLQGINDTLESLGKNINEYHLVSFKYIDSDFEHYTKEITAEKNLPVPDEDLHAIYNLNKEQKEAFDVIFESAMSETGGAYFIDGPGGTGKSFLYRVLLAHIRSKGFIAIIVASSGIASSCFLGGRTAHSRFKIPINASTTIQCQISSQSSEADLIRSAKIIIWDEAPMADKSVIFAFDKLLKDLCLNAKPFGDKLVVFGGDFRQVLPVVKGGGRAEQVEASLVSSILWPTFVKLKLTYNMRARHDPAFVDFLMNIGDGKEPVNDEGKIHIPKQMLIPYSTLDQAIEDLISFIYPDVGLFESDPFEIMKRAILCPKNECVDDINAKLIERLPGRAVLYISDDRAKNIADQGEYVDYLNSLEPRGLPQHKLLLKVNSPTILLRNLNPIEGLCNGTRVICKTLTSNLVGAVIATGQFKGKLVWIPRIPLESNPSDHKYSIPFVRRQIPLRLCFAMTINKAQGQTLDYVGIYLRQPVFTHGQLYVALSRAKTGESVKLLIVPPTSKDPGTDFTTNIVYDEVLLKAGIL